MVMLRKASNIYSSLVCSLGRCGVVYVTGGGLSGFFQMTLEEILKPGLILVLEETRRNGGSLVFMLSYGLYGINEIK